MSDLLQRTASALAAGKTDPNMHLINLDDVVINGGTQPRAALDGETIADYAEALASGAEFPPVILFYDGQNYWLADGFHRYHAHRKAQLEEINADVRQGDRRAAILYSVGANSDHGLRRTDEDKRRAVLALLEDSEWGKWSDREIARQCKVSPTFAGKLRASLTVHVDSEQPAERTYTTRHGTTATMNTANIGATKPAAKPDPPMEETYSLDAAIRYAWQLIKQRTSSTNPAMRMQALNGLVGKIDQAAYERIHAELTGQIEHDLKTEARRQSAQSPVTSHQLPVTEVRPLNLLETKALIARYLERHYASTSDNRKIELVLGFAVYSFAGVIQAGRSLDPGTLQAAKMAIAEGLRGRIEAVAGPPTTAAKEGQPADTSIGPSAAADMIRSIIAAGGKHPEVDDYAAASWAGAIEAEYGRRPMIAITRQALGIVVRERRATAQPASPPATDSETVEVAEAEPVIVGAQPGNAYADIAQAIADADKAIRWALDKMPDQGNNDHDWLLTSLRQAQSDIGTALMRVRRLTST